MTIKMIVFDLDGTLVNSLEGIAYSMNLVLKNHDLPIYSTEKYKYFVGNGLKVLTGRAIPPEKKDQLEYFYQLMLESYRKNYSKDLALYEGIADLLDELTRRGYKIGINTNKHQDVTEHTVDMVLSKWTFTSIVGSESGYPKKPDPSGALHIAEAAGVLPEECIYLGDTDVDLQTARNAGMKSVIVTWGFRTREDLAPFAPEIFIDKPGELLALL